MNNTTILELQNKLIGSLIGLVRATEGNESLITPSTNELILKGLILSRFSTNVSEDSLNTILKNIENEKRRLIPNCFDCMASCGRNDDYDMNELWCASKELRNLKTTVLFEVQELVDIIFQDNASIISSDTVKLIYKALYMIGTKDYGVNEFLPIIMEITETRSNYLGLIK